MVDKEEAGEYLRCNDCKKIMTKVWLKKVGMCPYCGGRRVRGANPTFWDNLLLKVGARK